MYRPHETGWKLFEDVNELIERRIMGPTGTDVPLVSVIIPCYNQAHFLSTAIESVLAQSHAHHEIIVVDDGSTDNTAEVTASYPTVRYIRQDNQGLSGARNTGLRESRGDYLVFLDADDLLLPRALEAGLTCMCAHPECAFVSGHYRYINQDGSFRRENLQQHIDHDHYLALLRGNYIGMHATVMYRRDVFEAVGNYATSLPACEDYDLFLRIARQFPVYCYDEVVAEYRQHGNNMSGDLQLMLKTVLSVLRSQWPYVKDDRRAAQAIRVGLRNWQAYYGEHLFKASSLKLARHFQSKIRILLVILRHAPLYFVFHTLKWLFEMGLEKLRAVTPRSIREYVARRPYPFPWPPVGSINFGDLRQTKPLRENSNPASGVPIDQFYVESFLVQQAHHIHGHILELSNDHYTRRFGGNRVEANDVVQLVENQLKPGNKSDLTIPNVIPTETYDCIIFPQILHRVYNLELMVQALYDCLKPGGVLLATVPGIGLVNDGDQSNAGYWAFTEQATQQLFGRIFGDKNIKVRSYGNVLTATAFLHNLTNNKLGQAQLDHEDEQYQLLVGVRAIKA